MPNQSCRRSLRLRWVLTSLLLAVLGLIAPTSMRRQTLVRTVKADNTVQSLPLFQSWSDINQITTNNDWSGVPGIVGYRGNGLASEGCDPQEILEDGAGTQIQVSANQTDPNTLEIEGLAEFDSLLNPVLALQGSDHADAPHLVISVSTLGFANVEVNYKLRDIDSSSKDNVNPVALQFRVGNSGDYTNVPEGFVPDATTGPYEASLVTQVSTILPPETANQPLVQIRIMGSNPHGDGEWVGLDDIYVVGDEVGPTVADGTIAGEITAGEGAPVPGTVVRLSGAQTRKTITDSEGKFAFPNVETSGFYTLTPFHPNFAFSPSERSFAQLGNKTDAVFTGSAMTERMNPLEVPEFFVRQQYVDLLGREPDEEGFNYWSERIDQCFDNAACVNARRRSVAAAFFVESEFQETGYFVYRLYKGTLGTQPSFAQFSQDRLRVVAGANLPRAKQALISDFIQRNAFKQLYPDALSNEQFVNRLYDSASLSPYVLQREAAIGRLNNGTSRAEIVETLIEDPQFKAAEYNAAFVLSEYFGYLRRDPDPEGYAFWLDVINNREPGNYSGMVCSFITSVEYQKRFGSMTDRTNSECGN